jgi:hypothetical protein
VQDWAVVPPQPGDSHAVKFGDGATLKDFERTMELVQNKLKNNCRFFVSSNSDEAKQALLSRFPDAVALYGDLSRHRSEGLQFALIEWLLLARCDLVLNTHGSSFAVEAAMMRGRPVVGIWHGRLVHQHNLFLPFCGHLQYANHYVRTHSSNSDQTSFDYVEGTVDKRIVQGTSILVDMCDFLDNWGLEDVVCRIITHQTS